MRLTVLNVAYPFSPVGPDAVGGAEQVLSAIDAALVREGHRSLVLACDGSVARGKLIELPLPSGPFSEEVRRDAQSTCRARLEQLLREEEVDVVHFHGLDFRTYLPDFGPTAIGTLHLPPD